METDTHPRPPSSHPPNSYTPPAMSSFSYPSQQQHGPEGYRPSPTGSPHTPMENLSLPPIRSFDPRQQQGPVHSPQQQQHPPPPAPGPGVPPLPTNLNPVAHMAPYFGGHVGQPLPGGPHLNMNVTSSPQAMRYPIPAVGDQNRMISGGRHKKEVKRRTKTGCLTCRKRRIKCDEGHPTCRNCAKSKRECLGYDPIFKSQPGPSTIQPAPNSASASTPTNSASFPTPPPGYGLSAASSYPRSLSADSPASSTEPCEYSAAIDPALDATGKMAGAGGSIPTQHVQADGKGAQLPLHKAKRMRIPDLLLLGGISPAEPGDSKMPETGTVENVKELYLNTYAPSIDKFLETRWYTTKGLQKFLSNEALVAKMARLVARFHIADQSATTGIPSQEAEVVWSIMDLCRASAPTSNGTAASDSNQDEDLQAAILRLNVYEALITGEDLAPNPIPRSQLREPNFRPTGLPDQLKEREKEFWYSLGEFVSKNNAREAEEALSYCRAVLDTFENRDVIYSIAVVHHIGRLFPNLSRVPNSADEHSALDKLYVATRFLTDEASGRGTNQVIQRLCGMAVRSFTP